MFGILFARNLCSNLHANLTSVMELISWISMGKFLLLLYAGVGVKQIKS